MISFKNAIDRVGVIVITLAGLIFYSCNKSDSPTGNFEILITDAKVIDGSGSDEFKADLLIRGDSIAYIGIVDEVKIEVAQRIDANGKIVSPGFIDAHAHGDPVANGDFKNFLSMGVTTICLGQDGFSQQTNNLTEWIEQIDSVGVGVNIITFIGHSTLRELSGTNYSAVPTEVQLTSMKESLRRGMMDGAFGLSTGLEYVPGYYAARNEMTELAKVVGEKDGLIMSHMRNEDDDQIENSIKELLSQGTYAPVHISHFKVVFGKGPERARQLLLMLDSARNNGVKVTADVYPYTASYTGIGIVFPEWAKAPNDYNKVKTTRSGDLRNFLKEKVIKRNGPNAMLFGDGPWRGMTLAAVADSLNKTFEDVLIEIGPEGGSGAYFVMNEELQTTLIRDSMICISSDGSPTMHHPRGYGSFAKVINTYTRESGALSLSEAIRKMTSLPASILGVPKRGLVKVGYKADLLIFDLEKVRDKATYEEPHQLAEGFDYVIVNGNIAKNPDGIVPLRHGIFLKKDKNE